MQQISQISISHLSQGCAATHLRCGGQCGMSFVANFLENTTVKAFFVKVMNECRVAQLL